ncbi:hypothetical protein DL766_009958 [Monosporascus sp. MC13-8B]|uniref:F-box domain-containing protein n=1 Tax=Monosporascus cannonballus TaxID=155416 RepID=A0ABY0H3J8_9PEZI|nr:hypothetical protein DL762_007407 [Monosporascus cannonballus]RYO81314.1 hypothetical protein DL763_008620 [Monosporascus cannonballus]RYP12429.1 hypothetical protein DL766_009958 [Monosporascus sp. MC13-8B]
MSQKGLLSLPRDVLVLLPNFLHNIEDYMNLASTCRTLRQCMSAATPNTILRLAAAQSRIFFRPSPHFLVAATARELGNWARERDANERELCQGLQEGWEGLLGLAVAWGGSGTRRPGFWDGGVDDAYTIVSDPPTAVFHLATYGELFAADLEAVLRRDGGARRLSVDTRLEYIKYCVPDWATERNPAPGGEELDPRRATKRTGPYAEGAPRLDSNNIALTRVINSSRWKPHWKEIRAKAGPDFREDLDDGWWYDAHLYGTDKPYWRQRLWENAMICQGLEGLGMIRPGLQDRWIPKIKEWREKIAKLDEEPPVIMVGRQGTLDYPYLLGDLRICVSGYVPGTY